MGTPSYSMGAKQLEHKAKHLTPGPGRYESQDKTPVLPKASKWSFGHEVRSQSLENRHTPRTGPGTYDPYRTTTLESTMGKVGTSIRKDIVESKAPGPGTYQPKNPFHRKTESWSIGTSQRPGMVPLHNTPGADKYSVNMNQTRANERSWAFGGESQRPLFKNLSTTDGVGPNTYDWDKLPHKGHMAPFHKSTRIDLKNRTAADIYIGPGKYNLNQENLDKNIEKRIGWSIRKHENAGVTKRPNPGPGAYESVTQERSITGTVFGDETRLDFASTGINHLGPGKYEPYRSTLHTTMGMFGKDRREIHKKKIFNV